MKRRRAAHACASTNLLDDPALRFLQVIWRLESALERVSKRIEDAPGISGPQRFALRLIGELPGVGAGKLAAALPPASPYNDRRAAAARGSRPNCTDLAAPAARRMHLQLTPAGRRMLSPAIRGTVEHAVRTTLASCSAAKIRAAAGVIERFRANS
jgi:MarR family transcriptional regulator, organic hydroperoxide resistance regulator